MRKIYIAVVVILVVAVIVIGIVVRKQRANMPSTASLQTFAQCLKNNGAVFYGAFWCPHCQAQKAAFGDAQKDLPYVECSTPDGQGQMQVCQDRNIEGYPTWVFADGSRLEGELSFETLAQKTGCIAPK